MFPQRRDGTTMFVSVVVVAGVTPDQCVLFCRCLLSPRTGHMSAAADEGLCT